MLVLTRELGESILIGDNIRVTITQLTHTRVRVGIEAPADVRVMREEIIDRVKVGSANNGEKANG